MANEILIKGDEFSIHKGDFLVIRDLKGHEHFRFALNTAQQAAIAISLVEGWEGKDHEMSIVGVNNAGIEFFIF